MIPVVILAGGLATRLRPVTNYCPKSLIKVHNKPFIYHQLRFLEGQGIKDVVICIGFLGDQIIEYLQNNTNLNLNIKYSFENTKLLGTGGSILNALPILDEEFFILYGDSWLEINYSEVYKKFKNGGYDGLMTIYKNKNKWDQSNVNFNGTKIDLYSKENKNKNMNYIDYGLGILKKNNFLSYTENHVFDLSEIYEKLSMNGKLDYFIAKKRFFEIGSKNGILELEEYFTKQGKIRELY